MIDVGAIGEIIATYKKHGWVLRRVLLCADSKKVLAAESEKLFCSVPIFASVVDAAWFSRPPAKGPVAWELRYLGSVPFAIVEHVDEGAADFESSLGLIQTRLQIAVAAKETA